MEAYLKIVESRMDQLIQIYISERKANGEGAIFLDFSNTVNVFPRGPKILMESFTFF